MEITVRFYAAARSAAGVAEMPATPSTVKELVAQLRERSPELDRIIPQCSILINEVANHEPSAELLDGDVVDFLPPFAGG